MHISSLPGPYGIGSMGKCAYEFVDFLAEAGQAYWQVLPLSPNNWTWRAEKGFITEELTRRIRETTRRYGRL